METEDKEDGTVSLSKKRREKKLKQELEREPSKAELFDAVASAINRAPDSLLPPFPARFFLYEEAPGVKQILEEIAPGEVELTQAERVIHELVHYATRSLPEAFHWTYRECRECFDFWFAITKAISKPRDVLWQDEEGMCFRRLPWKRVHEPFGDDSLFREMFMRTTNAEALMAWIGSLFDYEASRQQYIWLYGEGGNGKGALLRFLAKAFGRAYGSKNAPSPNDLHWSSGLIGKRLIGFPDCNSGAFPASGLFKSLTGDDPVDINPKYKAPFTAHLNCKFIFLSNELPRLSSEKADMRRAIFCEMGPIDALTTDEEMTTYEQRLWAQGGVFLNNCIQKYLDTPGARSRIPTDTAQLESIVSINEEDFEVFFEQHFELNEAHSVEPARMQECLRNSHWARKEQIKFTHWMMRTYGVKKTSIKQAGHKNPIKGYKGLRLKSYSERNV